MLEDVPNLAWCVGYTNASWTLRADITAQQVAKLLQYMQSLATPRLPASGQHADDRETRLGHQAGYVLRNTHALPKSATERPWNVRQNFFARRHRPPVRPDR